MAKRRSNPRMTAKQAQAERQDQFLTHYEEELCNLTQAALDTGISRQTVYDWINDPDSDFKKRMDDVERAQFDYVQKHYMEAIEEKNGSVLRHYMNTKGKQFGFAETLEVHGPGGGPIALAMQRDEVTDKALMSALKKIQEENPDLVKGLISKKD